MDNLNLFEEIKKIITKKNLCFVFVLVFFVFIPIITHGIIIDDLLAPGGNALDGIEELTGPVMAFSIKTLIAFIIAFGAFFISSSLLQGIIETSPQALTVLSGDASSYVKEGWEFIVGITNSLLVLGFVAIALCIMFGLENYGLKKSLPRLIGVTLLINFTLLFVGMGIDVSNFLFNSIAQKFVGEGNIFREALYPLINSGTTFLLGCTSVFAVLVGGLVVPYVNVATQIAFVVAILPEMIFVLPMLLLASLLALFSSVFFLFFVALVARVFIVQILAVISPLAFLCLISPDTKKYFEMWLKQLITWLLLGFVMIFFLYLAIFFAPLVSGVFTESISNTFPWWMVWYTKTSLITYTILLIYFSTAFGFAIKFVPKTATSIIDHAKTFKKNISPYAQKAKNWAGNKTREKIAENENFQKKMDNMAFSFPPTPTGNAFSDTKNRVFHGLRRNIGATFGEDLREKEKKHIEEQADKIKGTTLARKAYFLRENNPKRNMIVMLAASKGNQNLEEQIGPTKFKELFEQSYTSAKNSGLLKSLKEAYPIYSINYETKGMSVENKKKVYNNFVKDLKPSEMQKFSDKIIDAFRSMNSEKKIVGNGLVDSVISSPNPLLGMAFLSSSKGTSGIETVNKRLKSFMKTEGKNIKELKDLIGKSSLTREDYLRILASQNEIFAKKLAASLGGIVFTNTKNNSSSLNYKNSAPEKEGETSQRHYSTEERNMNNADNMFS
jgi:hypothetical protein